MRIRLIDPIDAVITAGAAKSIGAIADVSPGGFFVKSPLLPPEGTMVRAELTTRTGWRFPVHGVVRWNTGLAQRHFDFSGFGVRLTRYSEAYAGFVDGALAVLGPAPGEDPD